jgi:DNA-binding GntR family transcriptional regulator
MMADAPQRTITAQIAAQLRDMILGGVLPPGSRIDQTDLAQRFGVSVVPVREALARLQSSGLVRIMPHRGVFIEDLSADELVDIYNVRELLEEHAARLAADRLTDADLTQLEQIVARMIETAEAGDFDTFLELNRTFHFTIYRAAHRRTLLLLISQLWDRSTRYRHLQLHVFPDRARASQFETNAILAACRRHDRDAIGYLVRYKIHQTIVGLLDVIHTTPAPHSNGVHQ